MNNEQICEILKTGNNNGYLIYQDEYIYVLTKVKTFANGEEDENKLFETYSEALVHLGLKFGIIETPKVQFITRISCNYGLGDTVLDLDSFEAASPEEADTLSKSIAKKYLDNHYLASTKSWAEMNVQVRYIPVNVIIQSK